MVALKAMVPADLEGLVQKAIRQLSHEAGQPRRQRRGSVRAPELVWSRTSALRIGKMPGWNSTRIRPR